MDQPWVDGIAHGFLTIGRLEIPRCDNDPDHLDHGTLHLHPGRREMTARQHRAAGGAAPRSRSRTGPRSARSPTGSAATRPSTRACWPRCRTGPILSSGLLGLRTRDPGDFSIALLDSWAVTLDILTFYTERLANEAYLRTAVDQRSVTELAALVGYLPSPGVSASATLAFTLSTAPGAPASAVIPAGTRVQSVPGPGQAPAGLRNLGRPDRARQLERAARAGDPAVVAVRNEQSTWIAGEVSNISIGDALLFVAAPGGVPSTTGPAEVRYVTAVQADPVAKATKLTWDTALGTPELAAGAAMYAFRRKAALFGANAPSPALLSGPGLVNLPGYPGPSGYRWNYLSGFTDSRVALDSAYPALVPAPGGPPQWLALTGMTVGDYYGQDHLDAGEALTMLYTIDAATDGNPARFGLSARATTVTTANPQVLVAGSSARAQASSVADVPLWWLVALTPEISAYLQSVPLTGAPLPVTDWTGAIQPYPLTAVPLGLRLMPGHAQGALAPVAGPAITVTGGQQVPAGQAAGVSGKRMRLQVAAPSGEATGATFTPAGASGGSSAANGQVFLIDAYPPAVDPYGNASWSVLTTSGVAGTLLIPVARSRRRPFLPAEFLPADAGDPVTGEAVVIQDATPAGNLTTLTLAAPLSRIYDRSTVTVNANAVLATNGETVQEILGSGDPANPALAFALKQAPLTYLTAPVATGAQSTLQVWVNNLRWARGAEPAGQRPGRPRLHDQPDRRRRHRRPVRRRHPRRAPADRAGEHPGGLPQGRRPGRPGTRRPAQPAA